MNKAPLLSDLLTEVAKFAPDYIIDEESDGNVVIILNKKMDNSRLVDFIDYTETEED